MIGSAVVDDGVKKRKQRNWKKKNTRRDKFHLRTLLEDLEKRTEDVVAEADEDGMEKRNTSQGVQPNLVSLDEPNLATLDQPNLGFLPTKSQDCKVITKIGDTTVEICSNVPAVHAHWMWFLNNHLSMRSDQPHDGKMGMPFK